MSRPRSHFEVFIGSALILLSITLMTTCGGGGPTAPTRTPSDIALEDLHVDVIPEAGIPRQVAVVAISVGNPSQESRRDIRVSLVVPRGIGGFLGFWTGG